MENKAYALGKTFRLLAHFEKLCQGEVLRKREAAVAFGVNERTITRDIDDLRAYCSEAQIFGRPLQIEYSAEHEGYLLAKNEHYWLQPAEILAISRVLLESRAFRREEIEIMLHKLKIQVEPRHRKHISTMLANEAHHYMPLQHGQSVLKTLWDLSQAIRKKQSVKVIYQGLMDSSPSERILQPVGMVFSEYYFYLIAYRTQRTYDYPTIYRLDRIKTYELKDEHFHIPYSERFEEGEFRKRVQFMQAGNLMQVQIRYRGPSLEAILDRLPTARVISRETEQDYLLEAEVFGQGIKMWFLSQGENLEVIKPRALREEMKQTVEKMLKLYT